jgi:lipopolysaccharide export system protein LptC
MAALASLMPGNPLVRAAPAMPAHLAGNAAFIAAARHSRRVRFLRRAIPVAGVLAIAFLVTRSVLGLIAAPEASVESLAISGRKIVMENPKLSGYKRDGRSYALTASSAVQDITVPNVVELSTLTARMQTGKDGWADLKGAKGVYDSKIERLEVEGGVNVVTETGLDARLKDARIEFKAGTIVTDKPVEVKSAHGDVQADGMQVLDNGRRLVFEGRVRSVFVNPTGKGQTPTAPDPAAARAADDAAVPAAPQPASPAPPAAE